MRSQIEIAVAAALALNLPLYWAFTIRGFSGRPNPLTLREIGILLLVLGCYLAVPYLVRSFRQQRPLRAVPTWLWVSVLGATLIVLADYSIGISYGIERGERFAREWFALTVFTLPVTALVYYSRAIIDLIKKWHRGRSHHLSILRRS
jgi:hypothetical protein